MATVVIVRRWLIAPARARRELLPVLVAGLVFLAILIINLVRRIADVPEDVSAVLIAARDLAPAAIPVALLIGFYRQSERRLRAVVDAIPDRMVRFDRDGAYVAGRRRGRGCRADRWRRRAGRAAGSTRRCSPSPATGRCSATADALDTGRLQAYDFALDLPGGRRELEARVAPSGPNEVTAIVRDFTDVRAVEAEVRRSRARIVEATDEERRRLERDLHDGAQQRLVSVSLALRRVRARLAARPGDGRRGDRRGGRGRVGAQARDPGAARARPRDPPGDPDRGRPGRRDHGPRRAVGGAGDGSVGPGSAAAAGGRGDRLLRRVRGARERRQARQRDERQHRRDRDADDAPRRGRRRRRRRRGCRRAGPASAGSRTASPRSAGTLRMESPAGQGTLAVAEIPIG